MKKTDLVTTYYQSWVDKNIVTLEDELLDDKFGIRNFFKNVFFAFEDIEIEFLKFDLLSFNLLSIEEHDDIFYCSVELKYLYKNTNLKAEVITKFIFKNDLIIRVYETLDNPKYSRIKCVVSYDGSTFSGFQRQPELRTVQGDIEKGLKFLTGEDITIQSSGRTDKGVHALNQVFHFDTLSIIKPDNFWRVLNSYLPDSIYIKSSSKQNKTFHSRYDVFSKEYMYVINHKEYNPIMRDYEWFVSDFDIDLLKEELQKIRGTHDFTSFTKTIDDKVLVRNIIDVKIKKTDTHLYISIIGRGFLRYMIRYLVGTLIEIALGKTDLSIIDYINMKNSSEVKWKAPSCGLYLKEVIYYE